MDKKHFYARLTRWQHLHFNDVVLQECPDAPTWSKEYELYIQDSARLSAKLFIRTTRPGEDLNMIVDQYRHWLNEYNDNNAPASSVSLCPETITAGQR